MHLVEPGCEQPVVAPLVERQPRVDDARPPLDRGNDLLGSGHLGDPRGIDEAGRLDPRQPGRGEAVDELCPHRRLEDLRVVLEPVARPDVADA